MLYYKVSDNDGTTYVKVDIFKKDSTTYSLRLEEIYSP